MGRREKGSGTIYYDDNRKRWIGRISVGYKPNGTDKITQVSAKTQKEVKIKLQQIKADLLAGKFIPKDKLSIVDIANEINENKKTMNTIKISSYNRNVATIKIIQGSCIGNVPIQEVTERHIMSFLSTITNYSNSIINKVYGTINSAFRRAIKLGIINTNILADIQRPKSVNKTKKISALTIDEQKKFINAINKDNKEPYRTMLLISLFTGMRMGEIAALSKSNVSMDFKTINIERTLSRDSQDRYYLADTTKTIAGTRLIQFNSIVYNLLLNCKTCENEFNLIFWDEKKNKIITTNQVNLYFKRLCKRFNIINDDNKKYNQHMLRHTYATRCIESGINPKVLQHLLGHKDIKVTLNTYCDVFSDFEIKYVELSETYLNEQGICVQ